MNITIEDNRVIVNLDPWEVEPFRNMFENLDEDIHCLCEFREFAEFEGELNIDLKPMVGTGRQRIGLNHLRRIRQCRIYINGANRA